MHLQISNLIYYIQKKTKERDCHFIRI